MAKDSEGAQQKHLTAFCLLLCLALEGPSSTGYLASTLWDALHLNVKNSGEVLSGLGLKVN